MMRRGPGFLLLLLSLIGAGAQAAEIPKTASPGDPSRSTLISRNCPTFVWEQVEGARGYELAIYRQLDGNDRVELLLRRLFPSSVDSWTPSLEECLDRGNRYAWSVRAAGSVEPGPWSMPRLFRVAAGPSRAELVELLSRVSPHLRAYDGQARSDGPSVRGVPASRLKRELSGAGSSRETQLVAESSLLVDGGVEATAFTGDGSTLSSLDPAHLVAGTAPISVTGSSGSLNCVGCVSSIDIGTGQVKSGDIGDGEVTANDIDPNTVQERIIGSCAIHSGAFRTLGGNICETNTWVLPGSIHSVANSTVAVSRQNRLCFLSHVHFRDVDGGTEDAWCDVEYYQDPDTGSDYFLLEAVSEGDSHADCQMRCIEIAPIERTL